MIKKFKIILPIVFVFSLFTSFQQYAKSDPKDKVLLTILKYVLTQGHYQPQEIDDDFSKNVYDDFLKALDPSKRYFLQSDIDEFSKYRFAIDDQIKSEDLTFYNTVHDRFKLRSEEAKVFYKEILKTPFDFTADEILDVDYNKRSFATTNKELMTVWKKQLKFSTLSRLYDKINIEDDKYKEDNSYVKKRYEGLEEEAREATLTNMNDFYDRFDELNNSDWFSTFINCITEEFDPHTTYLNASTKRRFDISMAGKLEGIGARLQKKNDYTKVSELIAGGPAWKQGELEAEDLILKVAQGDEEPVDIVGMRLDDAIEYIKGKKGTEVRLTVKKIDGSIIVIPIVRDVVEIEETFVKSTVVNKDGRKFGVIDLPRFYINFDDKNYRNSTKDMAQEIERLKKENIEGIVLDLRNNPGGSLSTAIDISGLFIEKGPVVQVKFRGRPADVRKDKDSKIQWDGPLVILLNEFSASASEILAAAMQDYKRAIIIGGKQTYGKGTVQSVIDLNRYHNLGEDLGAAKMTIQKYYRVNGGSTQLEGVKSDIMVPSRYSYLKLGERDLDNPLKYDKVPSADYTIWGNYENLNETINNSKKRIGKNKYFKLIDDNAKWLKNAQDDTIVYLNLEAYKADIENNKKESQQFKSLKDFTTNLTYESPLYEKSLLINNEDLSDKRQTWHKNLKKDIYINEALNVLNELKIKSSHLLVKN